MINGDNKKLLIPNEKENLTNKISTCYKISTFPNTNLKLLSNYDEILKIMNSKKKDLIDFLYFNRNNIHEILYKEEKIINIEINENNRNLSYYFYLSLLISENKDIINYSYSVDYINDIINNYQNNIEDNNTLKKLIISKILLQIIDNYKNTDKYNEKDENHLKDIERKNEEIINNNINYLNELKINMDKTYITRENIDIIYIDIINSLLEQKKFNDYEYVSNIFNQMELKRINITEKMIDKLSSVLDIKNNYINEYLINNIDDLSHNNKINFYYILFKYIIKNNIYIYKFPLLIKIRKNIQNILKLIISENENEKLALIHKSGIIDKINYILERITDSKYYIDLLTLKLNNNKNNNKEISTKNNSELSSPKNQKKISDDNNPNNKTIKIKNENNEKNNTLSYLSYTNNEQSEELSSISKMQTNNIKNKDISGAIDQTSATNVHNNNEKKKYKIIEYIKIICRYNNTSEFIKELSTKNFISFGINNSSNIFKRKDNYNNIKINNLPFLFHYYRNDFEIEKKGYINSWINNIEEGFENNKSMIIFCYDDELRSLKLPDGITIKDYEDENGVKEYNCLFKVMKDKSKNFFLLCQKDKVYSLYYSTSKVINIVMTDITLGNYKEGIYIESNVCALTSNSIIEGEEDEIIFFNYNNKKIIKDFKGYSFILSTTGLCLMDINNDNDNDKILLCACKKYIKKQKNGILLINNLKKIDKAEANFYNTNNFEVYCFCPVFIIKEDFIFAKSSKFQKTNYFFVGGFDKDRNKGMIKLYRIKNKKNIEIEEIVEIYKNEEIGKNEEIKDNNNKKNKQKEYFKGFKGPISSIIQSTSNGNIIITCWDGNVYLFSKPNLDYLEKRF